MDDIIYLDHNATTPVDPRVLDKMLPYFTEVYGNAASIDHEPGHVAKAAVDEARKAIAKVINAHDPKEIIFTSGATESDNIAIFGVAERYADKGDHIITCVTEHKAVLDSCKELEKRGKRVTYLSVDQYGLIDLDQLRESVTDETILITIMFANNEIGTIQNIAEIGAIAHEHGVLFHTDAAQAVGHVPVDIQAMNIDLMSFSGHKIYGPKGIGGLFVRRKRPRVKAAPVLYGGGHELGLRSGTLNVPGIVGMAEAIKLGAEIMDEEAAKYREWSDYMLSAFVEEFGEDKVALNGHPTQRLAHNLNVSFEGIESRSLIVQVKSIALSTGSACTTAMVEPSHVINALGFGENRAHNAIRIGFGRTLSIEHIRVATRELLHSIARIQSLNIL